MTNQTPIKVECENCGYGRPWPGRYAEELEATKADLLAALGALHDIYACDLAGHLATIAYCECKYGILYRRARGED